MKEHVTVIPEDQIIIVDGVALQSEFEAHIVDLRALQWHDGKGELEIVNDGKISNVAIKSYTNEVKLYVDIWQAKYDEINTPYIPTIEEVKAAKLAEINSACDDILNAAVLSYPNTEILTFDQQTVEAKAYIANGNPEDAPLLSALASGRGIELDELVQRVIAKHDTFSALSGYIIGQRQALEDRLRVCETLEDVQAIEVNYTVHEAKDGSTN